MSGMGTGFDQHKSKPRRIVHHVDAIEEIVRVAGRLAADQTASLNPLLEQFLRFGFDAARFYSAAYNAPDQDELLLLTAAVGDVDKGTIGLRIRYRESTLGRSGGSMPAVGSGAAVSTEGERKWVRSLHLEDRSWVDIPLRTGQRLVGLIACDWKGHESDLSDEDRVRLGLLGTSVATELELTPQIVASGIRTTLKDAAKNAEQPERVVKDVLDELVTTVGAAIGAVFEYKWDGDELVKVVEAAHPQLDCSPDLFPERYGVRAHSLTSRAWQDEDHRHVLDVTELKEKAPHLLAAESMQRHTRLIGELRTVLYDVVGRYERRYLVRLINRVGNGALPYTAWQRRVLASVCADLSDAVDTITRRRRIGNLEKLSRSIGENLTNPRRTIAEAHEALADEGCKNLCVLWHAEGSGYAAIEHFGRTPHENPPASARDRRTSEAQEKLGVDDELYRRCIGPAQPTVLSLSSATKASRLLEILGAEDIVKSLTIPLRAGRTRGALLIALDPAATSLRSLRNSYPGRLDAFQAYAAIIGSALEASNAHLAAEGARSLVGHIGHEVRTPAAALGQEGITAVAIAREIALKHDPERLRELKIVRASIGNSMRQVGRTMDVAMMVAQENKGRLQLNFRRTALRQVLQNTVEALAREMKFIDSRGKTRAYAVRLSDSCSKLGDIVCDSDLLKQVFTNLIRNGMKYSLPRWDGQPMEIEIIGIPQDHVSIVQVKNWGLGIPLDEHETVFKAYARGSNQDHVKATRGMGLGLYITRRIMLAHEGTVSCLASDPTLDDPERRRSLEGYLTTFEVRIPGHLKAGVREHVWAAEA